ncbi:MAG TPA: DJ-1 family glyoxalase III [Gammaproteobacteria bacterium]
MARVLVPLAHGSEELEAVTIIDLLVRAGIEVVSAGLEEGPITASRGVVLLPQTTLAAVLDQAFDMIVLPGGGPGAERLDHDPRIAALVKKMANEGHYVAAICAAPKVLAHAGVLKGKRATSYPGYLDTMNLPDTEYLTDSVVQDGKVITSRGPGTAMDFALHLIDILAGRQKRAEVEKGLVRPQQ